MSAPDRKTAPPVRPFGRLILPPERVIECDAGTRLHVMADTVGCPLTRICVIGRGGKAEARTHAAAMLAAELLPEGSTRYDADATAEIIDFNGASISGRCSDHYTRLDITALTSAMHELLPVMAALLKSPDFSEARLEAAQAMLASQCAYEHKRVASVASDRCFGLIAGEGHITTRTPEPGDFSGIGAPEIKKSIRRIFAAANVEVFLSGGVTDSLLQDVMAMISAMRHGERQPVDIRPFRPEPAQKLQIDLPGAEQCAVVAMIPAVPRSHPDYLPLRIAVTALGGYFGSRLMQNIREDKGLTYGISSSLNGLQEGSYVEISAQCARGYTDRLLEELSAELLNMGSVPLCADEMQRVRLYEQTRIASMLDNAIASGDQYITRLVIGLPENYFSEQERITAAITPEQIADVSARYLRPEAMRTVIAG